MFVPATLERFHRIRNKPKAKYNREMDHDGRDKDTRTGYYLKGTSARQGFDGFTMYPAVSSPPGRAFVPRLTMTGTPKLPYEVGKFCDGVAAAPDDIAFFCDTSLFHRNTDMRLWDALLNRGQNGPRPARAPGARPLARLQRAAPAARAISDGEPTVAFSGIDSEDRRSKAAAEYYIELLGLRKKLVTYKIWEFEEEHERPPDDRERRALMERLHQDLGSRGYLLAKKGAEVTNLDNLLTDETLVYLAMKTGIETGREVVILSKDEDILEQFYKLQWLLDTHCRAMLLADAYAAAPSRFATHPMPASSDPRLKDAFIGDDDVLVERPQWLIGGSRAPILAPYCRPVIVHCWIVGQRFTKLVFCAEREMERLLHTKATTGGLNTYKFGAKNLHLWLAPLNVPRKLRGCAALARDRRIRTASGLIEIPLFDANQTIYTGERFMHITEALTGSKDDKRGEA